MNRLTPQIDDCGEFVPCEAPAAILDDERLLTGSDWRSRNALFWMSVVVRGSAAAAAVTAAKHRTRTIDDEN